MIVKFVIGLAMIMMGILVGFFIHSNPSVESSTLNLITGKSSDTQVVGFLPFWLLDKATHDYSKSITTLSYFNLNIDGAGKIIKLTNPTETDPGWNSLKSGKADELLQTAKKNHQKLSLVVFAVDNDHIDQLLSDPVVHAKNLVTEVAPVMKQYGFGDLNIDIESTRTASDSARLSFTQFIKEVKQELNEQKLGTLTLEISPSDFIHKRLIDPAEVAPFTDYIVVMAYDYHYAGSYVTGPVAPVGGGGSEAEFDTKIALDLAMKYLPPEKVILGIPLYGYEWETIDNHPRAPVIPGSGLTASNQRVEQLIASCASCSTQLDVAAMEPYTVYQDPATKTWHQIFYPDSKATQAKIDLAKQYKLAGIALWALGYEGETVMQPLNR